VLGSVRVATLNLKGDEQSDLTVHGGVHKAVYVYPSEHYKFWRKEIPGVDLPWGAFGENFTTEGLLEEAVHIGDRLRIGSAEFIVTQRRTKTSCAGRASCLHCPHFGETTFAKRLWDPDS